MRELNKEVMQELLAPFQSAEIRVKTHPYVAAYVTARVVMTRLSEVLPFQWSFTLGDHWIDTNGTVFQKGTLSLHGPNGQILCFDDMGSAPLDTAKGQAKQAKHAASDCLKRCAVHVGIGRFLYELQGVQGGKIPKPSLEKALAAVGYTGEWNDRHYGPIGGIREADLEDEPEEPNASPAQPSPPPAQSNGSNGTSSSPPSTERPTVTINEYDRGRIINAVERGGGNIEKDSFAKWLANNTANHAQMLDKVLTEDVEDLLRKLNDLAAKRKADAK